MELSLYCQLTQDFYFCNNQLFCCFELCVVYWLYPFFTRLLFVGGRVLPIHSDGGLIELLLSTIRSRSSFYINPLKPPFQDQLLDRAPKDLCNLEENFIVSEGGQKSLLFGKPLNVPNSADFYPQKYIYCFRVNEILRYLRNWFIPIEATNSIYPYYK